jgi:hypothetical protein
MTWVDLAIFTPSPYRLHISSTRLGYSEDRQQQAPRPIQNRQSGNVQPFINSIHSGKARNMTRKLMVTVVLALVLVLSVSAAVFAYGPGPTNAQAGSGTGVCTEFVDENGDGVCDNAALNGSGAQSGIMARRGGQSQMLRGQGLGADFVDADGDGQCDSFVDADGDGVNDLAPKDGTGKQFGQGRGGRGQGRNR